MRSVEKIFEINVKKRFTIGELNKLIPLVLKLTEAAHAEVNHLMGRIDSNVALSNKSPRSDADRALAKNEELEVEINSVINRWEIKLEKLGGSPKGLWLADFDFGNGYFCWKFPETEIQFYHGYQDGFSGRKPIRFLDPPSLGQN